MIALTLIVAVALLLIACLVLQQRMVPSWLRDPIRAVPNFDSQTVLVTGATGFIGRHWCRRSLERGDRVIVLTRDLPRARSLFGPHALYVHSLEQISAAQRIDAIVNLAGAPIMGALWTRRRRQILMDSRVETTRALVDLIKRLEHKPQVLVSMSAVGFYGTRGDEEITEADRGRPIFQSHLCQAWELAAQCAEQSGVRVVRLRAGLVLGVDGGALPRFALAARFRCATLLGSGAQWLSWIHIDDALQLIDRAITDRKWSGAYNATAPEAVTQRVFATRLLAQFGRGIVLKIPDRVLRATLGEMAQLLVDGQRVRPMRALAAGFRFQHPTLAGALASLFAAEIALPAHIMYDPVCPVCDLEMRRYCEQSVRRGYDWSFADVAVSPEVIAQCGIDTDTARRRIYMIDSRGRMHSGLEALLLIWSALPQWKLVARVLRVPGIKQIATLAYDLALAPLIWRWSTRRRARGIKGIAASHS